MNRLNDPAIVAARTAHEQASARPMAIAARAQVVRGRLASLAHEIAAAIADGDATRAEELREERARLERELPDLENGERIALQRAEAADRALARVEVPILAEETDAMFAAFDQDVERLNRDASKLREAAIVLRRRFNAAAFDEDERQRYAPGMATRLSAPAARIEAFLRDLADEPFGRG